MKIGQHVEYGFEGCAECSGQVRPCLPVKTLGAARREALSGHLALEADHVDQTSANRNELATSPEEGPYCGALLAAGRDRREKFWIHAADSRQDLGVVAIILPMALGDQLDLARVRDDDLVA